MLKIKANIGSERSLCISQPAGVEAQGLMECPEMEMFHSATQRKGLCSQKPAAMVGCHQRRSSGQLPSAYFAIP